MTKSTQFIIELIQTALSGMSFLSVPSRGWDDDEIEKLTKIVAGQGIAPLVGEAIRIVGRENFDDKFVMGVVWHTMVYESKTYARLKAALGNLASLFEDHGIPFMVMKGFDLGRHYPKPSMRYFTDIDFYNFGQFEQADALVASELGIKVHTDVHHHTTFELGGVHCENHFDFVNVHTHSENVEFEKILKSLAEKDCGRVGLDEILGEKSKAEASDAGDAGGVGDAGRVASSGGTVSSVPAGDRTGASILVPSPDFNALFVMRHMASHFAAEKILLRHLIDWALFVNAEGSRVDWPFVNSVFARFGMKDFSDAISGLCMRFFGMDDLGVVSDDRPAPVETGVQSKSQAEDPKNLLDVRSKSQAEDPKNLMDVRSKNQTEDPKDLMDARSKNQAEDLKNLMDVRSKNQAEDLKNLMDARSKNQTEDLKNLMDARSKNQAEDLKNLMDVHSKNQTVELDSRSDEKLQDKILDDIIASTWNPIMPTGRLAVLLWKFRRYRDAGWKRRLVYKSSGVGAFFKSVVAHLKKPASLWR